MTQPIQDPSVGVTLQNLFNLQGRVRPSLEEFVVPTVQIADLSGYARPPVTRRATCLINQNPVAGERFVMRFEAIPGTICVLRRIRVAPSTQGNFSWQFVGNAATLGALGTTAVKSFADGRLLTGNPSGLQRPSGVLTTGTQVGGLATPQGQAIAPVTGLVLDIPDPGWVVGTGNPSLFGFFEAQIATVNITVVGSMEWDEYSVI